MRLLFRTTRKHSIEKDHISESIVRLLREFGYWDEQAGVCTRNAWYLYLVGKEAGVYGWYQVMHCAIRDLTRKAESEASRYWLSALSTLAEAEWKLLRNDIQVEGHLSAATNQYLAVINQLKAFQALDQPLLLQTWFVQLRMEMVNAIQFMTVVLDQLQPNSTHCSNDRKLAKFMQSCAIRFRKLAFRYDFTAQSFYGIDQEALDVIESYKICSLVCEHAARTYLKSGMLFFCIDPSLIPLLNTVNNQSNILPSLTNHTALKRTCAEFLRKTVDWEESNMIEGHQDKCKADIQRFSKTLLQWPLILPRSFFTNQRNVTIQLTTDPLLSEKNPITLQPREDLVIKLEGLVKFPPQKKAFKVIKKAAIVCFVTREKIVHLDDRLGVGMIFADPLQALSDEASEVF
ncbi:hypothetical protein J3Q64DRAFT_1497262 [Phycomyces blakesleeanus]|uniref:Integrator complex subunit 7 helical bundle domain-containing protein n=1 Tax=Phycomyces blakesleeanus TaxID=4837 RepID=A0ABR3B0Q5_PHYBL